MNALLELLKSLSERWATTPAWHTMGPDDSAWYGEIHITVRDLKTVHDALPKIESLITKSQSSARDPLNKTIGRAEQLIAAADSKTQIIFIARSGDHITVRDNSGLELSERDGEALLIPAVVELFQFLFPK